MQPRKSAVAKGRPLHLSKKFHLVSDKLLMNYNLFIILSHQHVQHMTSKILLMLIDWDSFFGYVLIRNYTSLNLCNSGIRRDIKKQ